LSFTRSTQLSRRSFVRLSAAGLALLPATLQACARPSPGGVSATDGASTLKLPTYMPPQAPTPDLAGTVDGLPSGYFTYPSQLIKSVAAPPGKGGEFSPMVITASGGVPADQNAALQEINKQLGLTLKMNIVAAPEYITKTNTLAAAGEIPEMFYAFQSFPNIRNLRRSDLWRARDVSRG
jgi:putative aldouronate transport system substrate-binding protein